MIDVGAPGFPRWIFEWIGLFAVINSALINMLMASRLLYGMANERVLPKVFGTVHPFRRTPWVSIVVTSLIAAALLIGTAGTKGVSELGGTTALLLLCVFTVVNIAVLVLRKDKVEHQPLPGADLGADRGRRAVPLPGDPGAVRQEGERLLHRFGPGRGRHPAVVRQLGGHARQG